MTEKRIGVKSQRVGIRRGECSIFDRVYRGTGHVSRYVVASRSCKEGP